MTSLCLMAVSPDHGHQGAVPNSWYTRLIGETASLSKCHRNWGRLSVRAVGPQDVQPLAAAADAHVIPLPDQQPAAAEQFQAPDRVAGVHEVAAGRRPGLTPMSPILPHEPTLLVPVGLPEKSRRPCGSSPRCGATGPSPQRWSS